MSDKDSQSEHEEECEPAPTEEEIYTRVSDRILEALKEFDTEGRHPGMIKTD